MRVRGIVDVCVAAIRNKRFAVAGDLNFQRLLLRLDASAGDLHREARVGLIVVPCAFVRRVLLGHHQGNHRASRDPEAGRLDRRVAVGRVLARGVLHLIRNLDAPRAFRGTGQGDLHRVGRIRHGHGTRLRGSVGRPDFDLPEGIARSQRRLRKRHHHLLARGVGLLVQPHGKRRAGLVYGDGHAFGQHRVVARRVGQEFGRDDIRARLFRAEGHLAARVHRLAGGHVVRLAVAAHLQRDEVLKLQRFILRGIGHIGLAGDIVAVLLFMGQRKSRMLRLQDGDLRRLRLLVVTGKIRVPILVKNLKFRADAPYAFLRVVGQGEAHRLRQGGLDQGQRLGTLIAPGGVEDDVCDIVALSQLTRPTQLHRDLLAGLVDAACLHRHRAGNLFIAGHDRIRAHHQDVLVRGAPVEDGRDGILAQLLCIECSEPRLIIVTSAAIRLPVSRDLEDNILAHIGRGIRRARIRILHVRGEISQIVSLFDPHLQLDDFPRVPLREHDKRHGHGGIGAIAVGAQLHRDLQLPHALRRVGGQIKRHRIGHLRRRRQRTHPRAVGPDQRDRIGFNLRLKILGGGIAPLQIYLHRRAGGIGGLNRLGQLQREILPLKGERLCHAV